VAEHSVEVTHAVPPPAAGITRPSPYRYIAAFGAQLFLSADPDDVRHALESNIAAATILPSATNADHGDQLRIAFDGDAVLFSDESERIFAEHGLAAFNQNEIEAKDRPLAGGPFKPFLAALQAIQSEFPADPSPIRTALVTARGAPAHERVIRTLRAWGIRIDEALFLGGMAKGAFLKSFGADIFFDDQLRHCDSAAEHVATGHVPFGIKNS
jgi:5'-nucleotidase